MNNLESIIVVISKYFQHRAVSIWDLYGKCIFATDIYKKYLNIENVIGKTMGDFNDYLYSHQDEFRSKITNKVITNKTPIMAYYISPNKDSLNYGIYSIVMSPLFSVNNDIIGLISDVQLIENSFVISNLLQDLFSNTYSKKIAAEFMGSAKITRREHLILFLLLIGKGHKEISEILSNIYHKSILPNSISSIISKQIYHKFNVYNHAELMIVAFRMGIFYNVPHELVESLPMVLHTLENPNFDNVFNLIPSLL